MIPRAPASGTVVKFINYHNQEDTQDLPHPEYLTLYVAITGIIHMSAMAEHIENMLEEMYNVHVLVRVLCLLACSWHTLCTRYVWVQQLMHCFISNMKVIFNYLLCNENDAV